MYPFLPVVRNRAKTSMDVHSTILKQTKALTWLKLSVVCLVTVLYIPMSMTVFAFVSKFILAHTVTWTVDMYYGHGHGHAAQTRTCSMNLDMQHEHGPAAWTETWICSMDMNMDMQMYKDMTIDTDMDNRVQRFLNLDDIYPSLETYGPVYA